MQAQKLLLQAPTFKKHRMNHGPERSRLISQSVSLFACVANIDTQGPGCLRNKPAGLEIIERPLRLKCMKLAEVEPSNEHNPWLETMTHGISCRLSYFGFISLKFLFCYRTGYSGIKKHTSSKIQHLPETNYRSNHRPSDSKNKRNIIQTTSQ